jgi:protein-tyrosine-phosphatase
MAEGVLRDMLPEPLRLNMVVSSAGTHANQGQAAEPLAISAAREIGVDIRAHQAAPAESDLVNDADLILVMENMHLNLVNRLLHHRDSRIHLLGKYHPAGRILEIPDPYGGNLNQYRYSLGLIQKCMENVVAYLKSVHP